MPAVAEAPMSGQSTRTLRRVDQQNVRLVTSLGGPWNPTLHHPKRKAFCQAALDARDRFGPGPPCAAALPQATEVPAPGAGSFCGETPPLPEPAADPPWPAIGQSREACDCSYSRRELESKTPCAPVSALRIPASAAARCDVAL